jgi:hypothetical protein
MIDWSKLRKAATIEQERTKAGAAAAERAALAEQIRGSRPAASLPAILDRIDAIERLLGLRPLDAEK